MNNTICYLQCKRILLLLCIVCLCSKVSFAQPANDNCSNAIPVVIGNGGFSLGLVKSAEINLTNATLQSGETFASTITNNGINKKSVWFKFSLPTTRAVRVSVLPVGTEVQNGDAGFAVYKGTSCLPTNAEISTKFTPIAIFSDSYHPCVEAGDYLVQVTGANSANGRVFITVDVSDTTKATYDKPADAYEAPSLATYKAIVDDFSVQCQTIDNAAENCLPNGSFKNFTKSTWHTFTTPAYFDWLNVMLAEAQGNPNKPMFTVGYRIYEGNSRTTPVASLQLKGGCDSIQPRGYYYDYKIYRCGDLKPNTTYTVQLLYPTDFNTTLRFAITWNGDAPTRAPQPLASIPAPNNIGVLPANSTNNTTTTITDNLGCNSRHSLYNCPKSMPVNGVVSNSLGYKLSTFFSFKLNTSNTITFSAYGGCNSLLIRLYKQAFTNDCKDLDTANLLGTFQTNQTFQCLDSGQYVVQVMGRDTIEKIDNYYYGNFGTGSGNICFSSSDLGRTITLQITAKTEVSTNKFSLSAAGKFDKINANGAGVMQPLQRGVVYTAQPDTLGCANTVLPDDDVCKPIYNESYTKASFREFKVADSLIMYVPDYLSSAQTSKLYKGDANTLATSQSAFGFPQKITGLQPASGCFYGYSSGNQSACLTPGTYTLANFDNRLGYEVTSKFTIIQPVSKFNSAAKAENMGDIWQAIDANSRTAISSVDTFTCYDNPMVIDGVNSCDGIWSVPATKLIYRQFYLSKPALVSIFNSYQYPYYRNFAGVNTLFTGKATDGVSTLKSMGPKWTCFTYVSSGQCEALPVGWYTVVSYGVGPTYANPLPGNPYNIQYSDVGRENGIFIQLATACPTPQFNRPNKASVDTLTGKPYKIEWGPQTGHTSSYPVTGKKYTLHTENFDCSQDTAFINKNMQGCSPALVKVSFYVFQITQESYVQMGSLPYDFVFSMYNFDVRGSDSVRLKTDAALQPCLTDSKISEFCKLQPGTYTIVIYGTAVYSSSCIAITPTIYVDQIGYSRFDHAKNAYDFGAITPDSTWRDRKAGDVNPLDANRSPSNDFFYCTTGAQQNDPDLAACMSMYNPEIYTAGKNVVLHPASATAPGRDIIDRRNLWYTFTVNHPGTVRVRVQNKTPNKKDQQPFAIYKSDVDGTLPFSQVLANGLVDSTLAQGLTYVTRNHAGGQYYQFCNGAEDLEFFIPPCSFVPTRYYVMVENRNPYGFNDVYAMNPNSQVEVSVLFDSVSANPPKFDHYYQANDLGIISSGIKKGEVDNFTCATRDLSDPINYNYVSNCQKTLWYKFTTTVTGQMRYSAFFRNTNNYYYDNIQIFRQIKPNDSTVNGLQFLPYTTTYSNNGNWAQQCVSPGTYYILLPGCNALNEDVYPQVEIIPQAGDFCSDPMVATINGPGSKVVPVTVDCHTIGSDYGEFNSTLTCPDNAPTAGYKTSWYRLDISGKDTLDVTVYINEKTNATSTDIKYRLMTGSCSAMQEQSCVQDALTRNTYRCLAPGNSYYIQVFSPIVYNGVPVTGDIDLNVSALAHADSCVPANNCIGVANFTPQFDCTKDKAVQFNNFSTYGSSIKYAWDFGYNNRRSTAVSPSFFYPALTTDKTYSVKLVITNTLCGKKDSITQTVLIPARAAVNLGPDTLNCTNGTTLLLDATSHTGSTYYWYNGSTSPTITVGGVTSAYVEVTYKTCKTRDTVNVYISPIVKQPQQTVALCNVTTVLLNAYRGQGEQYRWSNGASTSNVTVAQAGYYWADIYLNGCTIRDSFLVVSSSLKPLGNDTSICQRNMPYTIKANTNGATGYLWQNGATSSTLTANQPGLYWVDITLGGCTFRDTLVLKVDSFKTSVLTAKICEGKFYTLPSGKQVSIAGNYNDTLRKANGCDSLITRLTLSVNKVVRTSTAASVCAGQTFTLPTGIKVSLPGIYTDTVRYVVGCDSLITTTTLSVKSLIRTSTNVTIGQNQTYTLPSGKVVSAQNIYSDTVRYASGCDSLISTVNLTVNLYGVVNVAATVCEGQSYTLPSGKKIFVVGQYADTLRYTTGFDSVITNVKLSVAIVTRSTSTISICAGQTYTLPSGRVVSVAGAYQDTTRYVSGCDSLVSSVNLIVKPLLRNTLNPVICEGQLYIFPSGRKTNVSGAYTDTIRYQSGCDSLITNVNLQVKTKTYINSTAIICEGQTYTLPSGKMVALAGVYADTLRYKMGCDSIITNTTISVKKLVRQTLSAAICTGQTYALPSGRIVALAGNYIDTVKYVSGCDSLVSTVTLSIKPLIRNTVNPVICAGQSYTTTSGKIILSTGTYSDTVRYVTGCDSLITSISLQVNALTRSGIAVAICEGQNYMLPSGKTVVVAGVYSDTLRYKMGCDSIITNTTLSVKKLTRQSLSAAICTGQMYKLPSGRVVVLAGNYIDTVKYVSGCDSLISNVTLSIRPLIRNSINPVICAGQSYAMPSGRSITSTGTYSDTLRYQTGCDSVITTVQLTVKQVQLITITPTICAGQTYTMPSGKTAVITGNYRDTLLYKTGCDSVRFTINLSVLSLFRSNVAATVCAGQVYTLPSGRTVNVTGVFADTVRYKFGCDSLISITSITLKQAVRNVVSAIICEGALYKLPSGKMVAQSGIYTDTLRYVTGCDSSITTANVKVQAVMRNAISVNICQGQTYAMPSGKLINITGLFSDTLRYSTGCDSIITTVNLFVTVPVTQTINAEICVGETYRLPSGRLVNTEGGHTDVVKNSRGCDSIVTNLVLVVNPLPVVTISKSNDINCILGSATLTATGGARYAWSPTTFLSSVIAANPVATPIKTTTYTAKVTTAKGCVADGNIELKVITDNIDGGYLLPSAFTPNSDGKNDCFGVKAWGSVSNLQFSIFDRWGHLLFSTTDPSRCWDGTYNGVAQSTAGYVYSISAITLCGPVVRKGTVVLIR